MNSKFGFNLSVPWLPIPVSISTQAIVASRFSLAAFCHAGGTRQGMPKQCPGICFLQATTPAK